MSPEDGALLTSMREQLKQLDLLPGLLGEVEALVRLVLHKLHVNNQMFKDSKITTWLIATSC